MNEFRRGLRQPADFENLFPVLCFLPRLFGTDVPPPPNAVTNRALDKVRVRLGCLDFIRCL